MKGRTKMKRRILLVGLAASVVAVPVAMAAKPATTPATPTKPAVTKPAPVVSYLFKGMVKLGTTPTATSVEIEPVKGTNIHAKRALQGATSMTVTLATTTAIRGRVVAPDGTKSFVAETFADLKPGDVVFFHIRAKKGNTDVTTLPAAKWLRDLTPDPATT
jgi:hypothetical protein